MDTIQAAVLTAKLRHLERWNAARRSVMARYRQATAGGPGGMVAQPAGAVTAPHLAVALVPNRDALRSDLARRGIVTAVHYPVPCHRQEPYSRYADEPLPVAEAAAEHVVSLPLFPHMTEDQVDQVCDALRSALAEVVIGSAR
jgi:dTDP-4-amino-4,6-dideoxygalactose transaminase